MDNEVTLSGTLNFRDVGGVPAGEGRRIAYGRLYRSDTLQYLTEEDVAILVERLGLRTDIDLRLPYEVEVEGRGLLADTDVYVHHLPFRVAGVHRDGNATPILTKDDPVVAHYVDYLGHSPASVARIVQVLAEPDALPAIIHCAAGKDRTGIAVAMTLAAAGCSVDDIAVEYAAGSHVIPAVMERLASMPTYGESLASLPPEASLTPPDYIHRFFAMVDEIYGGAIAFLHQQGVTDDQLAALRGALTEPVPAE